MNDLSIVIKGAGEMASGIAHRLFMANITRICMIEIENPLCVRRMVSFCETIFERKVEVEGVVGKLVHNRAGLVGTWRHKQIGIIIDPAWRIITDLKPHVKEVAMDERKVLSVDFENHKLLRFTDQVRSPEVLILAGRPKNPSAATRVSKQTIDDVSPETDNPGHSDAGLRIREYAITPGRVLQTLEKVIEAQRQAGDIHAVRLRGME